MEGIVKEITVSQLFSLEETIAKELFENVIYPWEVLPKIGDFILKLGATLSRDDYDLIGDDVWIAKSAQVVPSAHVNGPTIICANADIRHCAYIRGNVIIGEGAMVGNSTEVKNALLFNAVQVPHFNYVGDSILGYKAHLGAGAITSNVKGDSSLVSVQLEQGSLDTHLKKFGAILGDYVEVGCNTVLNPGTVVGKNSQFYPLSFVRGFVPANQIYKKQGEVVEKRR